MVRNFKAINTDVYSGQISKFINRVGSGKLRGQKSEGNVGQYVDGHLQDYRVSVRQKIDGLNQSKNFGQNFSQVGHHPKFQLIHERPFFGDSKTLDASLSNKPTCGFKSDSIAQKSRKFPILDDAQRSKTSDKEVSPRKIRLKSSEHNQFSTAEEKEDVRCIFFSHCQVLRLRRLSDFIKFGSNSRFKPRHGKSSSFNPTGHQQQH